MRKIKLFSLLMLLSVGVTQMWADDYELYSGALTEGDYLIVYSGGAMNTTVSSNRLGYTSVTATNNVITTTNTAIVWHIAQSGGYWTIYNAAEEEYAGGTSTKNQGAMLSSVTDYAKWTVTGTSTYDFENYGRASGKSDTGNKWLRKNGNFGFACYASGTGGALSLYKKKEIVVSSLSIKTAPDTINYKVGTKLKLTGLVLTADGKDVTSGYTASPAHNATLNAVGADTITITYGGKTVKQPIHVGALESIALTTTGVKTTYDEGQPFDPENLVVTATFSDGETEATTWTEDVAVADCSFDPADELATTDDAVTVSYTWSGVTETADIDITVNAAQAYTVTFDAGTGSCGTSSLTEPSAKKGVTLPTATIEVTGWSFAGWATASVINTEVAPTLYAASSTYKPTDNCTLYAVYKFLEGTEGEYVRATSLAGVKAASKVILVNGGKTLTTDLSAKDALSESEGKVTAADKTVFTLSGNDNDGYVLSGASGKIGANSLPNSNGNYTDIALTNSNSTWSITSHSTSNTFTFLNNGGTNVGLEYYGTGSKWVAYKTASPTSTSYYSTKVYIPNYSIAYNSNPAAMINPTVAFDKDGNKNLYVQDEASYTNAATVTGIAKTAVYTSSDETVATVSEAGVVTALKAGSTTITAKVAKEVGVNNEATDTYEVTVKDAKTIAGLKALTSTATAKSFTADLTDAVVTYVNGNYAYIQDASGAVYASCGSSLTAGKKINGAVSGSIKASNQIDEITAINLESATVTDGVIPSAAVISAAELAANKADYEGKLVSIENATVTASLTSGSASGGKISDDGKTTEINLYAPASNIEALKDAEGTFNGYISLYGGSAIRFNIYEQSQITLTKNAPTDQTLSFDSEAFVLDKPSAEYTAFAGQTVNGAETTPVYSIEDGDDENGVVTSINSETGVVVLSGNEGTATITVTAPEGETVTAGVTTPWNEATLTYTVQVRNIYDVNLVIKVDGVEEAHGNQATIAGGTATVKKHANETVALTATRTTGYQFVKWTTSSTDIEIAATDSTKTSGLSATVQGTGTIYANFTAVPELLVSETALDLGYAKLDSTLDTKTFKISGASLTAGKLTLALDEAIKDAFTLSDYSIDVDGTLAEKTITVTPVTSVAGEFSGNLTISGGGLAEAKTVALTSEIEQTYTVTWSVNGEETSQTDIENTTLTPPTTGTLAGKVFVGWAEAAIDGQTDVEPTFINIPKMPAEDKELYAVYASGNPAVEESETISLTSSQEDWVGTGTETYFSEPYGMKKINAKIVNKSIADFENYANTAGEISIGFKCLQNGGTGSRLTISLVDEDGNAIAGTGKEVTPVNTDNKANMTYKDVTYSSSEVQGKNATGYMVQCTTFDKSLLVNGTRYTITIASTLHAYITNAHAVTFDAPENGTLTVKNGENVITSGDMFPKNTVLTVEAEPASGYQLASLTANGVDIADQKSFSIGTASVEVVATFSQATALDNTELDSKAVKVMRNGILLIEKNGRTYNAQGQLIK